jgi:hypothetical protein
VCVSNKGDLKVSEGTSSCQADPDSQAVAVNESDAVAFDDSEATAVNDSFAFARRLRCDGAKQRTGVLPIAPVLTDKEATG